MKQRIALFRWTGYPHWEPYAGTEEQRGKDPNFMRVTEYVEVDFPELTAESVRTIQIDAITKQRAILLKDREQRATRHAEEIARMDEQLASLQLPPESPSEPQAEEERTTA